MEKRKYTHLERITPIILSLRERGNSNQEVADQLGLEKEQVKNCIKRHNRKVQKIAEGRSIKPKGRPRKDGTHPKQDVQKELARLRMENKLLRDFLQSTERM